MVPLGLPNARPMAQALRLPFEYYILTCLVFVVSWHLVAYNFYTLLKSLCVGQQFMCGKKKDNEFHHSDTGSFTVHVTDLAQSQTSLNHTLNLYVFFASAFPTLS